AEVFGEVVQLPLVVLPVPRRKVLSPREGMLSTRDPAVVVDRAVREDLEVLPLSYGFGLGVVECAGDRDAIHGLLLDTFDALGRRQLGDVEDRGNNIDQVGELITDPARVLDSGRP